MAEDQSQEKELLQAAEKNDISRCKLILQEAKSAIKPFNIDCMDESCTTPLQVAAYKGNLDLCKLLIAHGSDVNHHEHKHGYTALMFAALSGKPDVVRLLLEHGAKTHVTNSVNRTASQMAGFVGYHHIVATISNFLPRYYLAELTKVRGLESEAKLPIECLGDFYYLVNQLSVHPVRIAYSVRERPLLLEHETKVTGVLEMLCERFMKLKDDTNDRMAFKMHIYAEVLREIVRPESEKSSNKQQGAVKLERAALLEKADAFVRRMLVSRESDGYLLVLEKFARRMIQRFPYMESELLQTIVRQLASRKCRDAGAASALTTLSGAIFTQFFVRNEEATCVACGDVLPVREDDEPPKETQTSTQNCARNADERRLRKCSACRVAQYCSVQCQKAHWFSHKRSCGNMRTIREQNEQQWREKLEEQTQQSGAASEVNDDTQSESNSHGLDNQKDANDGQNVASTADALNVSPNGENSASDTNTNEFRDCCNANYRESD